MRIFQASSTVNLPICLSFFSCSFLQAPYYSFIVFLCILGSVLMTSCLSRQPPCLLHKLDNIVRYVCRSAWTSIVSLCVAQLTARNSQLAMRPEQSIECFQLALNWLSLSDFFCFIYLPYFLFQNEAAPNYWLQNKPHKSRAAPPRFPPPPPIRAFIFHIPFAAFALSPVQSQPALSCPSLALFSHYSLWPHLTFYPLSLLLPSPNSSRLNLQNCILLYGSVALSVHLFLFSF